MMSIVSMLARDPVRVVRRQIGDVPLVQTARTRVAGRVAVA
jgi:hypothetical protein